MTPDLSNLVQLKAQLLKDREEIDHKVEAIDTVLGMFKNGSNGKGQQSVGIITADTVGSAITLKDKVIALLKRTDRLTSNEMVEQLKIYYPDKSVKELKIVLGPMLSASKSREELTTVSSERYPGMLEWSLAK